MSQGRVDSRSAFHISNPAEEIFKTPHTYSVFSSEMRHAVAQPSKLHQQLDDFELWRTKIDASFLLIWEFFKESTWNLRRSFGLRFRTFVLGYYHEFWCQLGTLILKALHVFLEGSFRFFKIVKNFRGLSISPGILMYLRLHIYIVSAFQKMFQLEFLGIFCFCFILLNEYNSYFCY